MLLQCIKQDSRYLSVPYSIYRKYWKIYFMTKLHHTLKKYFLNIKLLFERALTDRRIQEDFRWRRLICCFTYRSVQWIQMPTTWSDNCKITRLHFYMTLLRLIHSYLIDRYQRVKINNSYSLWGLTKYGAPQGSIVGPILFKVFLYDMFFLLKQ